MFKIFYHPSEVDRQLEDIIADAANRLDVGEFQLLQLAYAAWFGRDLEPERMEAVFFNYLYKSEIPSWARHYARSIVGLDDAGRLDSLEDRYHRYDAGGVPEPGKHWKYFVIPLTLIVVVVYLYFLVITNPVFNPVYPSCYFPPCI